MKKDTSKLEKHLQQHPTDASSVIALLKRKSHNYMYDYELESKKKHEKHKGIQRKRLKNDKMNLRNE
ncbi:MAG: hypothetical protein ABFD50_21730 [Smithella sp.]